MKIIYIAQFFSFPHKGSTHPRAYQFAKRLVAAGHQVTVISGIYSRTQDTKVDSEFIRYEKRDGLTVIWINVVSSNYHTFFRRIQRFLSFAMVSCWLVLKTPCDLIIATSTPLTVGVPALAGKWLKRIPFVFEVRDLWPELPIAMGILKNRFFIWIIKQFEKRIYKSASRIIALAPGIRDGIIQTGKPEDKVALIPNGCDLDLFVPSSGKRTRKYFKANKDDLVFVYAGAHGQANHLDAVIDGAVELQNRQETGIQFILIGDGNEKPRLINHAQELGLKNIQFLPPVTRGKMSVILQEADVGMQILKNIPAFYWGTSPNKFFDYISVGLPVLINYPGWLAEMIKENQCGMEAKPDDPASFADIVLAFRAKRQNLKEMGKRSKALAEACFDRNQLATAFINVIENASLKNQGNNR